MNEPIWLENEVIKAVHARQIQEHGGRYGIRDENLLYSALQAPQNSFHYEKSSLLVLAAKTVYTLATNHPFVDGNKRTAYIAMRLFLKLNGYEIVANPQEKIRLMIEIADSKHTITTIEQWLKTHSVQLDFA